MAASPAHTFGQFLGNLLEDLILPELEDFCSSHGLYLDKSGPRPSRAGKKVTWEDDRGNKHDLDFVVEKGGSPHVQGRPVAFIEVAWRRYTKHSKNKAQEIQGAVLPIIQKHRRDVPFIAAILGGNFTEASIVQLKSQGFEIVYIEYDSLIADFKSLGFDVAFDEDTPEQWYAKLLADLANAGSQFRERVISKIRKTNRVQFDLFFEKLAAKFKRNVEQLIVIPLFSSEFMFNNLTDAMDFLSAFKTENNDGAFKGFEIVVRFSNGDRLDAMFHNVEDAKGFLEYAAA